MQLYTYIIAMGWCRCLAKRGRNRSRSIGFPIFDMMSSCGDIRDQSRRLCKIAPNIWHVFGPPWIFGLAL